MEPESNEQILSDLMDNIRSLHEENAKLKQEIELLRKLNTELFEFNCKLSKIISISTS